MFDFAHWREWLRGEAERLRADGFSAEWRPNDGRLRNTEIRVIGNGLLGSFRQFENGLVDYEIFEDVSSEFRANEAMISVDDQNFPATFEKFRNSLGVRPLIQTDPLPKITSMRWRSTPCTTILCASIRACAYRLQWPLASLRHCGTWKIWRNFLRRKFRLSAAPTRRRPLHNTPPPPLGDF